MNWRAAIPNGLTLCNLACGVISILILKSFPFQWGITLAATLVCLAAVFDVLDGATARMLKTNSSLGAQLDSLADMVSFGVAPSVMIADVLLAGWLIELSLSLGDYYLLIYLMLSVPALATAYRLARFNIQQHSGSLPYFEGLPSPASGMMVAICCVMAVRTITASKFVPADENLVLPLLLGFLCSLAMVSRWPFLSFKGPTLHKLALVAVFATGAAVAYFTAFQPWVVLATLALYALVSRLVIRPSPTRHAAQ